MKFLRVFLALLIAGGLALFIALPAGAATTIYEQNTTTGTNLSSLKDGTYKYQTFTAASTHYVNFVWVWIARVGTLPDPYYTVSLRSTTGGEPDTILTSGTLDGSAVGGSAGWVSVSFNSTVELTSGTLYSFGFDDCPNTGSNYLALYWSSANPYADGQFYSSGDGVTWSGYATYDQSFKIGYAYVSAPTAFTASQVGPATVQLSWTCANDVQIWASKDGYPWAVSSAWMVYQGGGSEANITIPEFVTYYYSAWGIEGSQLSTSALDSETQGGNLNTTLSIDPNLLILIIACFLLAVSIFINKQIMVIACFVAWFTVIMTVNNTALDGIAGVIMLLNVLRFFALRKKGGNFV